MANVHNYSFFGKKVGLTIQSTSITDLFIFFRLIKSKENGIWEKPSKGEGKVIKFSLEEMVMILQVLKKEVNSWSSFHTFKNNKTQISFKWENNGKNRLWINIDQYSKMLDYAQLKILELLFEHILHEKIEFATIPINPNKTIQKSTNNIIIQEEYITEENGISFNDRAQKMHGVIKNESEKALLISFNNGSEVWIPKSKIHSKFESTKDLVQVFLIEDWILKKNNIIN